MSFLFAKPKTEAEKLAEHKASLKQAMREVTRERLALERQEQMLIMQIKETAQAGRITSAREMAKNLVRMRSQIDKMHSLHGQLQTMSMQMQSMKTSADMMRVMSRATQTMMNMNAQIDLPAMQQIMLQFEKQNEIMGLKQEMMDNTLNDMASVEGESAATDEIVEKTLSEIGIELGGNLAAAPSGMPQPEKIANPEDERIAEIEHMLDPDDKALFDRLEILKRQ